MSERKRFEKVTSSDSPSREDMPMQDDAMTQPAKLTDRAREGQRNGNYIDLNEGNTYGMGDKFARADKVTKMGGSYQDFEGPTSPDYGNYSQKNSSISRLDMVNKQTNNTGTAYNSDPIPETYKPATSNGVPNANAVEYNTVKKNRE